jgi:ubiquitin-conjugating enzyme E2 O
MDMFMVDFDTDEYTESSDSEELEDRENLFGVHKQNILTSLNESIRKIDDFLSFERGFSHGDIISHISDPSGQLGRVVDIDMVVDFETQSGEITRDVNSRRLVRVRPFMAGDHVVMGSWICRVNQVFELVNVRFNDGTKCEILVRDLEMLVLVTLGWHEEIVQFYNPRQRVRTNTPRTVSKAGLVQIYWISSLSHVCGNCKTDPSPTSLQEPNNLKLLSCFQYANWKHPTLVLKFLSGLYTVCTQ